MKFIKNVLFAILIHIAQVISDKSVYFPVILVRNNEDSGDINGLRREVFNSYLQNIKSMSEKRLEEVIMRSFGNGIIGYAITLNFDNLSYVIKQSLRREIYVNKIDKGCYIVLVKYGEVLFNNTVIARVNISGDDCKDKIAEYINIRMEKLLSNMYDMVRDKFY